jgi:PLP dependent protein
MTVLRMTGAYRSVIERVETAARRSGRTAGEVTVVAVSKGQPVEAIGTLHALGHRHFGENRADELAAKAPLLPDDITWHFVGTIQRRRIPMIRAHAALVHSFDRTALVAPWGGDLGPPALVQVNLAAEPQKHGVAEDGAGALVAAVVAAGIRCRGLMVMPPVASDPELSRPWFRRLAELRIRLAADHPGLTELSMGMTDDFEVAVEEGASLIRVGRAIFGERM